MILAVHNPKKQKYYMYKIRIKCVSENSTSKSFLYLYMHSLFSYVIFHFIFKYNTMTKTQALLTLKNPFFWSCKIFFWISDETHQNKC